MNDIDYKKTLARHLDITDLNLLRSVVAPNEFKEFINLFDENAYKPDNWLDINKVSTFDCQSLGNNKFFANLHVHTNHSDGLACVSQILDCAIKIADENAKNGGFGFLLAITDHDTIDGVKEALNIIIQNPEKYRNLKLVTGVEISTVGVDFSYQKKTLDIHTLFYCLNPFDEQLNMFLNEKMHQKYNLACETLNFLKKSLSSVLEELNLNLSLEDAAKIHPMITKGQDEVSHPLKKYIYGEILFSYYVQNNANLLKKLEEFGVDNKLLSYEKPVYMYKSMFNNERYFFIYKDALQKYLNFITNNKYNFILPDIPETLVKTLLTGKEICEKSHPSCESRLQAFSYFEETLKFLNSLDSGVISIAHPARINVHNIDRPLFDFFNEFWDVYKKNGKDSAFAYEKYYRSYTSSSKLKMLDDINKAADLYKLAATGGIDSHGFGICTRA